MNIYVGNLAYETSESDLRALFEQFGNVVSVKIVSDFNTGRSKGFGFVEMEDSASGEEAIGALDGTDFKGRTIKVNEARPKPQGGGGGGRSGGGSGRRF
ncbi:MAG: RNA-binding protein [Bdellovibrionales bacterium]|nr:RNA-binding protein [Bdellovibrionales bacterium]